MQICVKETILNKIKDATKTLQERTDSFKFVSLGYFLAWVSYEKLYWALLCSHFDQPLHLCSFYPSTLLYVFLFFWTTKKTTTNYCSDWPSEQPTFQQEHHLINQFINHSEFIINYHSTYSTSTTIIYLLQTQFLGRLKRMVNFRFFY